MAEKPHADTSAAKSAKPPASRGWKIFTALTDWPVITLAIFLVLLSLGLWWLNRDPVPREIVIAAGPKNQAYERAGIALKQALQSRLPEASVEHNVNLDGSPANAAALVGAPKIVEDDSREESSPTANIAIVQERELSQLGHKQAQEIVAAAPLFHAVVCVAIDVSELGDGEFFQLSPQDPEYQLTVSRLLREQMADDSLVNAGDPNSGTRRVAQIIADHYRSGVYSHDEQQSESPDAAGATANGAPKAKVLVRQTAWLDKETLGMLRDNEIELVSIDAAALAQQSEFHAVTIPAGAYGYDKSGERIPRHEITTIGSTDFVAVRADASEALVTNILDAIYADPVGFASKLNDTADNTARPPIQLISQTEILSRYLNSSFHPAAQAYYQPFDPSELATWTDLLAGSKDLLVAFAAGVFLLYGLRVRMERRREDAKISEEKEVLDEYLEKTIQLEGEQWNCRDPEKLEKILAEVTAIKIEALHKLSHEDLRNDRAFSIFLMQCANVINKVQMKILAYRDQRGSNKEQSATHD